MGLGSNGKEYGAPTKLSIALRWYAANKDHVVGENGEFVRLPHFFAKKLRVHLVNVVDDNDEVDFFLDRLKGAPETDIDFPRSMINHFIEFLTGAGQ